MLAPTPRRRPGQTFFPRPGAATRRLLLLAGLLLLPGCVSTGRLAEYDFRDRSVALVLVAPPRPDVLTGEDFDLVRGSLEETLLALGTEIVKEHQASRLRERLDEATARVDVSALAGDRALEHAARILRMEAVESVRDADYELEVQIREYGIEADGWDAQARFFVEARLRLLDAVDGAEIWASDVSESDPVNRDYLDLRGPWGDVITAAAMASLEVHEIERALAGLAEYAADRLGERLQTGWEKARG